MEKHLSNVTVRLLEGDITELDVDAIVNAANNELWMGAGVAGAIKRKGGQVIEDEAMKKGPIPVGEAVVTTAGALRAKWVIHAAAMGTDLLTDAEKVRAATRNALKRFQELGLSSIALPALGTGVGGFPVQSAANVMLSVVKEKADEMPSGTVVIFALFGQPTFQAFQEELAKLS
jgi:O-acetyl-ADP-ribose deacetylase (regulator of RNase III)